jgi:hypothetical protein
MIGLMSTNIELYWEINLHWKNKLNKIVQQTDFGLTAKVFLISLVA